MTSRAPGWLLPQTTRVAFAMSRRMTVAGPHRTSASDQLGLPVRPVYLSNEGVGVSVLDEPLERGVTLGLRRAQNLHGSEHRIEVRLSVVFPRLQLCAIDTNLRAFRDTRQELVISGVLNPGGPSCNELASVLVLVAVVHGKSV